MGDMQTPSGAGAGVVTGSGGMVEGGAGAAARAAATAGERTTNLHGLDLKTIYGSKRQTYKTTVHVLEEKIQIRITRQL